MEDFFSALIRQDLFIKFMAALVTILLVLIVIRLSHAFYERSVRDVAVRYRKQRIATFFGVLAILFALAFIFNERLGGLIPALGIVAAGVAFALQEVITSIAGWIAIAFTNFYRVGDRVQLGGIKGDVIDIGTLRTTVMEIGEWVSADLYSGRIVRIANSFIFKEPVFNYSAHFPFVWDEIKLPITYKSDIPLTRSIFLRIADEVVSEYIPVARKYWLEMGEVYILEDTPLEPRVFITANDNWIEFTLRYVVEYKRRRAITDRIFTRLLEEIDLTGGKVSMASATFQIVGVPDVNVRVKQSEREEVVR